MYRVLLHLLARCTHTLNQSTFPNTCPYLTNRVMQRRIRAALQKRRNKNDKFRLVNGYSWDYVMAFNIYDDEQSITSEQRTWNLKRIMAQLASGGLQIRLFYNTMHNVVYCKIRASQMRLMKEAVRTGMRLQLDEEALRQYCRQGRPDMGWAGLTIPDKSIMTHLPPFQYITAPYEMNAEGTGTHENMLPLYKKWPMHQLAMLEAQNPVGDEEKETATASGAGAGGRKRRLAGAEGNYVTEADGDVCQVTGMEDVSTDKEGFTEIKHTSIFRMADRLKLIYSIINNQTTGGCHINTEVLLKNNCMLDMVALHDHVSLRELQNKWITLIQMPWNQQTTLAKDYFGGQLCHRGGWRCVPGDRHGRRQYGQGRFHRDQTHVYLSHGRSFEAHLQYYQQPNHRRLSYQH